MASGGMAERESDSDHDPNPDPNSDMGKLLLQLV